MNSFDVIISYDSENIQLVDWALGDLVSSFNWKLAEEYADGYFHLSYSEYGLPAVDGDGVLLHLYFTGLEPGVSSVTIDYAAFAEPVTGDKTYPVLEHGIINVGYATSAVGGSILLQGQPISACIPVSLGTGVTFSQGPFNAISTALIGNNLSFPPVVNNDTYTLTTAQPGYLNLDATLSVPAGMDVILPPICLLGGDANGDSIISTGDLDAIRDAFGLLGSGIIADINADGVVDLRDLALAAGNYGLTSAEAYSGWGP